ncbi:hypothetical protein Lser_V15G11407 [Lactuca serriola]
MRHMDVYMEQEEKYTKAILADTDRLQSKLQPEMASRMSSHALHSSISSGAIWRWNSGCIYVFSTTYSKAFLINAVDPLSSLTFVWECEACAHCIIEYFHSNDNHVIAGALLGVGVVNCGIKNDCDLVLALFVDYLDKEDASIRIGPITGLGLAYVGTQNEHDLATERIHDAKNVIFTAQLPPKRGFTHRNVLRVYPKGIRVDSSNYNPLIGWMHGAQMVAFNMQ